MIVPAGRTLVAASFSVLALCARASGMDDNDGTSANDTGPRAARYALFQEELHALQLSLHLDTEAVSNLDGGLRSGTATDTVIHAAAALDTARLGLWNGGRLAASAIRIYSGQPSQDYVGDLQGVSNIEARPATRLYQFWYRQQFPWLGLRAKAGLIDMNQDFVATDSAGRLLNASFGLIPSLSGNFPVSTYPRPGVGLEAAIAWRQWHLQTGLFQSDPADRASYFKQGHVLVAEAGYDRLDGANWISRYKLGVWHYESEGGVADLPSNDWGMYWIFEHNIVHHGRRSLDAFLQLGASPKSVNRVPYYLGAGFLMGAPFTGRPHDLFTAGVACARIRDASAPAETSYELSYVASVNRHVSVQPDVQYVTHPSGSREISPALVATIRLHLEFP
jgi:porin